MWKVAVADGYENRLKRLHKSNSAEIKQVLENLATYEQMVRSGVRVASLLNLKFVRNAQSGIHEIDQSPLKKGFLALRLYVYVCEERHVIYLLGIGTKDQQFDDIRDCVKLVREVRAQIEKEAESADDSNEIKY